MKISQLQIEEILDEGLEITIRRAKVEGYLVVETHRHTGDDVYERTEKVVGTDLGEMIDEVHTRL